jgi:uncharacterized protein
MTTTTTTTISLVLATAAWLTAAAAPATAPAPAPDTTYRDEITRWREQRETRLRSETGWLTVAGLFWLKPGPNTFGGDPASDIVLPQGAPAQGGTLTLTGDRVSVVPARGVTMQLAEKPVTAETALPLDGDSLRVGRLSLQAIRRGDRYGIRLRDPESRLRREFKGLEWFPIDPAYRVVGRLVPDDKPRTLPITSVLGMVSEEPTPGRVELHLAGRKLYLRPYIEDGDTSQWFYVFRDATAPGQTYGGGRFFYSDPAKDGTVVIDFNKAYNPPCAFNPYTTCPLPPKENQLPIAVPAGELKPPR